MATMAPRYKDVRGQKSLKFIENLVKFLRCSLYEEIWINNWVGPFMYMEFQKSCSFLLNFCNLIYNCGTYILYVHSIFFLPDLCQEYFRLTFSR